MRRIATPRSRLRGIIGRRGRGRIAWWTMGAAALAAFACATANIGSVRVSPETARAFDSLQVDAGYRYWYLNQENAPYGVAGLVRDYRIEGPQWQPAAPDTAVFRKVVGLVRDFPAAGRTTSGFLILDPQGRTIGVWYSSLSAGITVDPETRVVSIATAMPSTGPRGP